MMPNVRDQRRRALGAPLADRVLSAPDRVPASGVTTRADRCIALLDHVPGLKAHQISRQAVAALVVAVTRMRKLGSRLSQFDV
jgi:hypothetical protein